jgi:hypothetical protein
MTDTSPQTDTDCHDHAHNVTLRTSAHVTGHCLIGCSIGEVTGLIVGTAIGLGVWSTLALATALAFVVGMSLAVLPLVKDMGLKRAVQAVWLGEVVSIAVMEFAMNATDYALGGVQTGSLAAPMFWIAMAVAIPAGFIAAWPVNHWLVSKQLKACH